MLHDSESAAVVIVQSQGRVSHQNSCAERLLGAVKGQCCWDHVGGMPDAAGLPCTAGCTSALLQDRMTRARRRRFSMGGRDFHLTCVPSNDKVVCVIARVSQAES